MGPRRSDTMPLTSCSTTLLFVVLDRHDEEDQQGEALDPRQQEEVVVELGVIDVTWKEGWREGGGRNSAIVMTEFKCNSSGRDTTRSCREEEIGQNKEAYRNDQKGRVKKEEDKQQWLMHPAEREKQVEGDGSMTPTSQSSIPLKGYIQLFIRITSQCHMATTVALSPCLARSFKINDICLKTSLCLRKKDSSVSATGSHFLSYYYEMLNAV